MLLYSQSDIDMLLGIIREKVKTVFSKYDRARG